MRYLNRLYNWVGRLHRHRLRHIDRKTLFPLINKYAESRYAAQEAIQRHVKHDKAWCHPEEWEHEDIETGYFIPCGPHCDH